MFYIDATIGIIWAFAFVPPVHIQMPQYTTIWECIDRGEKDLQVILDNEKAKIKAQYGNITFELRATGTCKPLKSQLLSPTS